MRDRHRICINCQGTLFEKVDKKTIKCLSCGFKTDIRRNERFRSKKKTIPKEEHGVYVPVEVICSCGELLIAELLNPWDENKQQLKLQWANHRCKKVVKKDDTLYY